MLTAFAYFAGRFVGESIIVAVAFTRAIRKQDRADAMRRHPSSQSLRDKGYLILDEDDMEAIRRDLELGYGRTVQSAADLETCEAIGRLPLHEEGPR